MHIYYINFTSHIICDTYIKYNIYVICTYREPKGSLLFSLSKDFLYFFCHGKSQGFMGLLGKVDAVNGGSAGIVGSV